MNYRPDIDGLRAIAVLAVVLFHVFPEVLPGGFTGVDIFFVSSGYLISSILLENLAAGHFSLWDFYGRRIRRIFPPLIAVLLACLAFGWFALFPKEYWALGKHTVGGASFLSNFFFWQEAGYFDNAADTKPLLHLWSLAIEEQFYIVWPLLLWLGWKARSSILWICIGIALASFALNLWGIYGAHDLTAAFYSPQTRFWELLIGALLAITTSHAKEHPTQFTARALSLCKQHANVLSCAGLLSIVIGVILIHKTDGFPGAWALLPTLGALLLLASGPQGLINRILLSNKLMIGVGLISYSLYLWHWPILSFLRITEGQIPLWWIRVGGVVAAFILATLTYFLIERPIRFGKYLKAKTISLIVLMVLIGVAGYNIYSRDGLGFRNSIRSYDLSKNEGGDYGRPLDSDGSCKDFFGIQLHNPNTCITNSEYPEILIIGDSHAMALSNAIFNNLVPKKAVLVAAHTCPLLKGMQIKQNGFTTNLQCEKMPELILKILSEIKTIKTILITTRGPYYFSGQNTKTKGASNIQIVSQDFNNVSQEELFFIGTTKLMTDLKETKKGIIYLIDVPELKKDPENCFSKRPISISNWRIDDCKAAISEVLERQSEYRIIINKLQSQFPNFIYIDSIDEFCDKNYCYANDKSGSWYHDDNHVSTNGSKKLLEYIFSKQNE